MEGIPTKNNAEIEKEDIVNTDTNVSKEGNEKFIIDCDADPFVPEGWTVEEHQKGGQFEFDATRINLCLFGKQKSGLCKGNEIRKGLADRPVLNANVLDYLLANPQLIPWQWSNIWELKRDDVYFWGTIYHGPKGSLFVRCLQSLGRHGWCWSCRSLDDDWGENHTAALRAS